MEILNRYLQGGRRAVRRLWRPALLVLLCAAIAGAGDGLPHWLTVITADQLRGDVGFLASEELAGRAVLSPGSRTAASFIASRFQAVGLKPAGEGDRDWYQNVPLLQTAVRSGVCRVEGQGKRSPVLDLVWGEDFRCHPMEAHGIEVSAEAVFAGYGIHAPELGHDDYSGLEVKGRVVIVLAGGPTVEDDPAAGRELWSRRFSSVTAKRSIARSRGAAALVVLPQPGTREGDARLRADFWPDDLVRADAEAQDTPSCPAILLQEEAAGRLVGHAGIELVSGGGPPRRLSGIRVSCRVEMGTAEKVQARNVLGLIPGRDELHFREFIIVSAHYDHLGARGDGRFYPGADDNASGVAAMLGAARALAALPLNRRPARSILFAAWAGEERGFLGSEHFGDQPTVPRGQIKMVVNLDMVGRNNGGRDADKNTALAIYSAQAPGLEAMLDDVAQAVALDLRLRPRLQMDLLSDHKIFHRRGIPVVHFFTGLHADYNRPGDTADKINYDKLLRVSQTAAGLAFMLADEPELPSYDVSITEIQGRTDEF